MVGYEYYRQAQDEREYFGAMPDVDFNEGGIIGEALLREDYLIYRVTFNYDATPIADEMEEYSIDFQFHRYFFREHYAATLAMIKAWAAAFFAKNVASLPYDESEA